MIPLRSNENASRLNHAILIFLIPGHAPAKPVSRISGTWYHTCRAAQCVPVCSHAALSLCIIKRTPPLSADETLSAERGSVLWGPEKEQESDHRSLLVFAGSLTTGGTELTYSGNPTFILILNVL